MIPRFHDNTFVKSFKEQFLHSIESVMTLFGIFLKFILKSRFLSLANFNSSKLDKIENSSFKCRTKNNYKARGMIRSLHQLSTCKSVALFQIVFFSGIVRQGYIIAARLSQLVQSSVFTLILQTIAKT